MIKKEEISFFTEEQINKIKNIKGDICSYCGSLKEKNIYFRWNSETIDKKKKYFIELDEYIENKGKIREIKTKKLKNFEELWKNLE